MSTGVCQTIGCGRPAVTRLRMSLPKQREDPFEDDVCRECADGYLRRPALQAVEIAPEVVSR